MPLYDLLLKGGTIIDGSVRRVLPLGPGQRRSPTGSFVDRAAPVG